MNKERAARQSATCPIPFGLSENSGRICEPREVPLGRRCGCICPACRSPLVAKHCMSGKRTPHFAHARGADCKTGFETALHLAAKQRILERGAFWFPALSLRVEARDAFGLMHRAVRQLAPDGVRQLSSVAVETPVAGVRPDLVVRCADFGAVLIEIAVTHFVDDAKLGRIAGAGLPAVEVDLSYLRSVDFAELDRVLFEPNEQSLWLHHPERRCLQQELEVTLEQRLAQAREDAAAALAAARAFAVTVIPSASDDLSRQYVPCWVEELEAAARTKAFRKMPERDKGTALRASMRVAAFPRFLVARCRYPGAFGVSDYAIWQGALFHGLVDTRLGRGSAGFDLSGAFNWLAARFAIPDGCERDAQQALVEYLAFLRAIGAVSSCYPQRYRSTVADTHALAAAMIASQPGADIDRELRWAAEDEWPGGRDVMDVYDALGLPTMKGNAWLDLARLAPSVCASAPSYFCAAIGKTFGIERGRLLGFLAQAGFLRIAALSVEERA